MNESRCHSLLLFISAGGPWLITDMRRGETIFELDPGFQEKLEQGKSIVLLAAKFYSLLGNIVKISAQNNNNVKTTPVCLD